MLKRTVGPIRDPNSVFGKEPKQGYPLGRSPPKGRNTAGHLTQDKWRS